MQTYIENLALLAICFLYRIVRGKADKAPATLRRVLVMQNAKIGDMICATPIFQALKEKFPEAHLTVSGNAINKLVMEDNPDMDEYLVYFHHFIPLWKAARKNKYDAVFITTPDSIAVAAFYLAGVPFVVAPHVVGGPAWVEPRSYQYLRRLVSTVPHTMYTYVPREFLRVLEPVGIYTDDTTKHLGFKPEVGQKVEDFLRSRGSIPGEDFLVGIAPSAGNKVKNWYPERYQQLIKYLRQKYQAKIIIIGSKADRKEMDAVIEGLAADDFIDASVLALIGELKALCSKLDLFISGDTGPIHVADALRIPTVDILGPVGEVEMPPRGPFNRNVFPPRDKPVLFAMTVSAKAYDMEEAKRQMDQTTVEMVISVVDKLIADVRSGS
jgi:heptosyltransferase-2